MTSLPRLLPALSPALEDYVEAVFVLGAGGGEARVSEIARLLEIRQPSVTRALRRLAALGLVRQERYGAASLSERGAAIARSMVDRHATLVAFFTEILGVPPSAAEQDARQAEHVLSPLTLARLAAFVEFARARRGARDPIAPFRRAARRAAAPARLTGGPSRRSRI